MFHHLLFGRISYQTAGKVVFSLKNKLGDYLFLFSLAGVVVVLDQLTKAWVRAEIPFQHSWSPWAWLAPYARIVHWKNTGAAFGMFQNLNPVFMVLSILIALAILYYFPQTSREDWTLRLAMGLQFGGAIGNLIDRVTYGYVTDFISVGTFPVFNVADSSISVGVAILIVGIWYKEKKAAQLTEKPDELPHPPGPEAGQGE